MLIIPEQNPQNPMYTQLGVLTKGTIIEVNGMLPPFPSHTRYLTPTNTMLLR